MLNGGRIKVEYSCELYCSACKLTLSWLVLYSLLVLKLYFCHTSVCRSWSSQSLLIFVALKFNKRMPFLWFPLHWAYVVTPSSWQFNQGKSVMQLYVASRPMFMDVERMNEDSYILQGPRSGRLSDMISGLSVLYKDITGVCTN